MNMIVILLIVLLVLGSGGLYGRGAGWNMGYYGGFSLGGLIILLIVLKIFGVI